MKQVLIVDDERPFLLSFTDGLASYTKDLKVLTALNGKEAEKILTTTEVDLVVTDLRMPKMDGFELLAYMSVNCPDIPVIVMTAYGTPEIEERLQTMGTFQYLEKPLDFNVLADKIFEALAASSTQDHIHGISLPAFLQLLEMEHKTCILTIKSHGRAGHLYFVKGRLMDAEAEGIQAEAAALDIVTWEDVEIEIEYRSRAKKGKIEAQLTELLLEGFRIKDENGQGIRESLVDGRPPPTEVQKEERRTRKEKEVITMRVQKLNEAVEILKTDLGNALIATDIWTVADGQSLAAFNAQPKAVALFNQVTAHMVKSLKDSGFPALGRYYLLDLVDGKVVIVLPLDKFQWGMLLDSTKAQLGLVLNVVIPKAIDAFEAAREG